MYTKLLFEGVLTVIPFHKSYDKCFNRSIIPLLAIRSQTTYYLLPDNKVKFQYT